MRGCRGVGYMWVFGFRELASATCETCRENTVGERPMDANQKGTGDVKRFVKHWFAWIRESDEGSGTISGVALIAEALPTPVTWRNVPFPVIMRRSDPAR